MKIGIIGSGYIGGTLTRRLTALGHTVYLANSRGPASLQELAAQTGAHPVSVQEAAASGEVVIVTIPQKNIPDLPTDLFAQVPANVIVVDTGNYYPGLRDGRIAELDAGEPDSKWTQRQLGRPVVKAFNSIVFISLADKGVPAGTPGRIGLPVAGDDKAANAVVRQLVEELGFDAVDGGSLTESWRQQPGSPIYCTDKSAADIEAYLNEIGSVRTPELLAQQVAARSAQEQQTIDQNPEAHYGSPNHKRS